MSKTGRNKSHSDFGRLFSDVKNTIFMLFDYDSRRVVKSEFLSFVEESNYLEKGNYRIDYMGKPCLYNKRIKNEIFDSIGRKISSISAGKEIIVSREPDNNFQGQLVIMTMNRTFKCFDFVLDRVLTIQPSSKTDFIVYNINYFDKYFTNTYLGLINGYIVEKRVKAASIRSLDRKTQLRIFKKIIEDQIELVNGSIKSNRKDSIEQIDSIKMYLNSELLELMYLCREKSLDYKDISSIWMHCDIHFGNVLLEQETNILYYIDFEYCREEIIIYDIINCAFVEFLDSNNKELVDFLFNKENFELIKTIVPNLLAKDISQLLYRFLISRIEFDVLNAQTRFSQQEINQYYKYIESRYKQFITYIQERGKKS